MSNDGVAETEGKRMARYKDSECVRYVGELQAGVDRAKPKIQQQFNDMDFSGAREQVTFELYHTELLEDLNNYRKKVGSYSFLPS